MPDEVKVYPCALIEGSRLVGCYERGEWRPIPRKSCSMCWPTISW